MCPRAGARYRAQDKGQASNSTEEPTRSHPAVRRISIQYRRTSRADAIIECSIPRNDTGPVREYSASLDPPSSYDSAILVYGLFGLISLYKSEPYILNLEARHGIVTPLLAFVADYLIFITSRKRVSRVLDTDIYLARDFKVFPIDPSTSADAINKHAGLHRPNETFLLSLIKGHLYSGPFYYTYGGYDITSRMQAQDTINDKRPMFERV